MQMLRLEKIAETSKRCGDPVATLYWRIKNGDFVPTVKQGERAAAFVSSEVDAIILARIMGATPDVIREIVRALVAKRSEAKPLAPDDVSEFVRSIVIDRVPNITANANVAAAHSGRRSAAHRGSM